MCASIWIIGDSLKTNGNRGCCKFRIQGIWTLLPCKHIESRQFELGKFKWQLAVQRVGQNSGRDMMLRFYLFSCNVEGIHAFVELVVQRQGQIRHQTTEEKKVTACPFRYIVKQTIPLSKLLNENEAPEMCNDFTVTIDLRDIAVATYQQQRCSVNDMRPVSMEIVTDERIRDLLRNKSDKSKHGVVAETRKLECEMPNCTFVRPWATSSRDVRYWLCIRRPDGCIDVTRCLDDAKLTETFETISTKLPDGTSWITLFKEVKQTNEDFPEVKGDTMLIFCKLYDEVSEDPSYLGHLFVSEKTQGYELPQKMSQIFDGDQDREDYQFCLEGVKRQSNISSSQQPLKEHGLYSGCVVVVEQTLADDNIAGSGEFAGATPASA